ncbi:hypothetical protein [Rhodococcoides kroppenstedtii]|nr:hypothetical protein [Rhodococcus kroppenstedtii]
MIEMRLKAIGVVDGMLDDPELEPSVRLRAAQIVLDRTGMGPTSKIEHEVEVKPYEKVLNDGAVIRDVPVEDEPEIIDAEVVEGPAPTAPDGRPVFDPSRRYATPEPDPDREEHNVVAFPQRPGHR